MVFIAGPSFSLIYGLDYIHNPKLTLRVIGNQWFWQYEYMQLTQANKNEMDTSLNDISSLNFSDVFLSNSTDIEIENSFDLKESVLFDSNYKVNEATDSEELDGIFASNMELFKNIYAGTKLFNNNRQTYNVPNIFVESYMVPTEDLVFGSNRLLEVDNRLVLPTNVQIRVLVTSNDVLHS